jgi:hypothetical protein
VRPREDTAASFRARNCIVRACSCRTHAFAVDHLHRSGAVRACARAPCAHTHARMRTRDTIVQRVCACVRACGVWHLLSLPKASSPAKRLAIGDARLAGSWRRPDGDPTATRRPGLQPPAGDRRDPGPCSRLSKRLHGQRKDRDL